MPEASLLSQSPAQQFGFTWQGQHEQADRVVVHRCIRWMLVKRLHILYRLPFPLLFFTRIPLPSPSARMSFVYDPQWLHVASRLCCKADVFTSTYLQPLAWYKHEVRVHFLHVNFTSVLTAWFKIDVCIIHTWLSYARVYSTQDFMVW